MMEPTTYVRERGPKGERSSIIVGKLPDRLARKISTDHRNEPCEAPPVVYQLRLDRLPNGENLARLSLAQLDAMYDDLKARGALPPPNTADPKRTAEGKKGSILGESWHPPRRPWRDRPPDPLPVAGTIKPRPDAGGFIGPEQIAAALETVT